MTSRASIFILALLGTGWGLLPARSSLCAEGAAEQQAKKKSPPETGQPADAEKPSESKTDAAGSSKGKDSVKPTPETTPAEQAGKQQAAKKEEPDPPKDGMAALKRAAEEKRYLFIFFYRGKDAESQNMKPVFHSAMKSLADRADGYEVDITDSKEEKIVRKFGVLRAPMPLVLVVTPGEIVAQAFPVQFTEKQLAQAFIGPATEKSLKALQNKKVVIVCIQNEKTEDNDKAMKGVRAFQSDPKYAKTVEVVRLDPENADEARFLKQLRVDSKTKNAITVMLAPPGKVAGTFKGATEKKALETALASCGSNCGPSG